jgi:hypothetical protein
MITGVFSVRQVTKIVLNLNMCPQGWAGPHSRLANVSGRGKYKSEPGVGVFRSRKLVGELCLVWSERGELFASALYCSCLAHLHIESDILHDTDPFVTVNVKLRRVSQLHLSLALKIDDRPCLRRFDDETLMTSLKSTLSPPVLSLQLLPLLTFRSSGYSTIKNTSGNYMYHEV